MEGGELRPRAEYVEHLRTWLSVYHCLCPYAAKESKKDTYATRIACGFKKSHLQKV